MCPVSLIYQNFDLFKGKLSDDFFFDSLVFFVFSFIVFVFNLYAD